MKTIQSTLAAGTTNQATSLILKRILAKLQELGVRCKMADVHVLFMGGDAPGLTDGFVKSLEDKLGYDSAGAWIENQAFFKKIGVSKTDYTKLADASL